ncbi:MliC family protein [Granulosicoccaceae sp. 1_MG-2023]|nr:MliC family protein [Granulosicoccaceae sp. 1_MG-2023]
MKIRHPLTFASLLMLGACAPLSDTADETGAAAAAHTSDSAAHEYLCGSGELIRASYIDDEQARISYNGDTYDMRIALSASGARYVGDGLEWWSKGSGEGAEGLLLRHRADGTSGEILESCTVLSGAFE